MTSMIYLKNIFNINIYFYEYLKNKKITVTWIMDNRIPKI